MPLSSDVCLDLELECNTVYAYANHLLCAARDALGSCFRGGSCRDHIRSYLSMGAGDDGIPDSLIVVTQPMVATSSTATIGPSLYQLPFDVRLRESGYPISQAVNGGNSISYPDPDLQHYATMQSMAHGEAIHRRLSAMKSAGALSPDGYRCTRGLVGQMVPLPPQGGVVGWSIIVTLTIPWG